VSSTVLFLGLTSLFTDISSEMVSAVLPLYFIFHLGFTPLAFGLIDGVYQGGAALVRLAGGFTADRWQRHKEVAVLGYGLSAVCKLGLLAAGSMWGGITAVIMLDRAGKGIRTAPRDALISLSSAPSALGTAFGVHRALDTAGALLGPLVAFAILTRLPTAFDAVFVVSFCAALIGLAVLVLFVQNRPAAGQKHARAAGPAVSLRATAALLAAPRFLALVVVGGVLGIATLSDGFLYLVMQRRAEFSVGVFPLLYVGTALAYFVLAIPAGWLADRVGRAWVFVGGHLLLLGVYTALLQDTLGRGEAIAYLALFGAYYAATDGVLMALASAIVPASLRASGMALLTTVTTLARLLGSVLFGALWTWHGMDAAITIVIAGLAVVTLLAALILLPLQLRTTHGEATAHHD
jgi:MFS family permease